MSNPTAAHMTAAYALTAEMEEHGDLLHHTEAHRYVPAHLVADAHDTIVEGYGGDHRRIVSVGVDDDE